MDSFNERNLINSLNVSNTSNLAKRKNSSIVTAEKVDYDDYITDLPNDLKHKNMHKNIIRNQLMSR